MAFVLTPRLAPTCQASQCSPFGFCAPVSRPAYTYRVARPRPQPPQYSSFNHFFSQVDDLLSEIDREAQRQAQLEAQREAQRQAHRQRQQRKRALRAQFAVNENEQDWHIDGQFQGFDQENISIEVTDEHTMKIAGNTTWQAEKKAQRPEQQRPEVDSVPAIEQQPTEPTPEDRMDDGVTLNEAEFDTVTEADTAGMGAATLDSDTQSHKSYQATVEDDYEDLGAETSSLISSPSRPSSPAEVNEPKGKEKAVETSATAETAVTTQPQSEAPAKQQEQGPQQEERVHGSFTRTFKFLERIDVANVSASFKDGALKIVVPKAPVQQVRSISIF
jgi:HSP20 family molecular chaperone IbpA